MTSYLGQKYVYCCLVLPFTTFPQASSPYCQSTFGFPPPCKRPRHIAGAISPLLHNGPLACTPYGAVADICVARNGLDRLPPITTCSLSHMQVAEFNHRRTPGFSAVGSVAWLAGCAVRGTSLALVEGSTAACDIMGQLGDGAGCNPATHGRGCYGGVLLPTLLNLFSYDLLVSYYHVYI